MKKKRALGILMSLIMISGISFQFAFAAQTGSNTKSNTNTQTPEAVINTDQKNTAGSDAGNLKTIRRTPETNAATDLSGYLTDNSTVQFKYDDPYTKNEYTVNYSLKSGNVSKDGNTDIKDKDGEDLDLYHLKNIKVLLAASFSDDEKISADQTFTYTLPGNQGVTWTGSIEWQDLKGSDGTSYGTYKVTGNELQVRFNNTFINLENRFASITIDSTFDNSGFKGDSNITFTFPGIGTFEGKLLVPKALAIKKMDSMINVDKDTDIVDAAENHSKKFAGSTTYKDDRTYPYIWISDDGVFLTQILKVTVTGDQSGLVIEDYYNAICSDGSYYFYAKNNNWDYDSTVKLVKKSANGTTETLTEGRDYTLSDRDGIVRWSLKDDVKDGDVIYVAYKAKYDNGGVSDNYEYPIKGENGKSIYATSRSSKEKDCARTASDNVTHYTYDSVDRYVKNYGISKSQDKLDTADKTIHWVIYYNLGMNFNLLDGQTIRDLAEQGKLIPENDSVNITLIPVKGRSKIVEPSQFATDGVRLVTDGKAVKDAGHGDWSDFNAETFMSSNGYKIPEGTGYGSLKIEFTTSYDDPVSNTKGSAYSIKNTAYYNKEKCSAVVDVSPAGLAYPDWLQKNGEFAQNKQGKKDPKTGRIKWTSRFAISKGRELKLEYRDKIGFGQRLVTGDENYPMTVTYSETGASGGGKEIESYKKGVSDDPGAVYYQLKINDDIDKDYGKAILSTNDSQYGDPSFVIHFVNSDGEEVKLSKGIYTVTYYTQYSPNSGDSYDNYTTPGDIGLNVVNHYHRNNAWLIYNNGRNYVFDSDYRESKQQLTKGSDITASKYSGDSESVPKELYPKAADELFWSFTAGPLTETTSKVVFKDTFKLPYSKEEDVSDGGSYYFNDPMKLKKNRFIVYNGDKKLSSDQYDLEETIDGFRLTLSKEKGYDPTKNIKVCYMTKVPVETMKQGDVHHYGNQVSMEEVYDESMEKLTGKETAFPTRSNKLWNGDYQTYRYRLLSKGDDYDPSTQYITYSVVVNPYELTLNDGKTVELTDTMDEHLEYDVDADGNFVVPVQVVDKNGNAIPASDYQVDLAKNKDGSFGPLKLTVPDGKMLTIKYRARVKPGVTSLTDIKAVNSVNFTTGNYRNAETSSTVSLTNLAASAGGSPVYLTVVKSDADNKDQLLDGAEYQVTVYQRQENSDGSYSLVQERDTQTNVTKDGVFTNKTSYGHVIKIQEMKAPEGYLRDDGTEHYYVIERPDEGTKAQWQEWYKDTFLKDVNWDSNVEMITSNWQKTTFQDTVNKTDITAEKIWSASDGKTSDNTDHGSAIYFKLYRKTKSSTEEPVAVEDVAVKKVPASGTVTWKDLDKYTDQDKTDEWVYSVKETDADGNDLTPAGYSKKEEGLKVTNTRNEVTEYKDASVTVVKVDEEDNDRPLENAAFTVYSDPDCQLPVQVDGNDLQFVTGRDGKAELSTASGGVLYSLRPEKEAEATYYFKETSAPTGYRLSDQIRSFTISADRVSKWNASHSTYVNTVTYEIKGRDIKTTDGVKTFTVENQRNRSSERIDGRLTLTKQDSKDGTLLSGAQFTLYKDKDCTEEIRSFTTDENGMLAIDTGDKALNDSLDLFSKDAEKGAASVQLYLKETRAPKGYKAENVVLPVQIEGKRTSDWNGDHSEFVTTTEYRATSDGRDAVAVDNNKVVNKTTTGRNDNNNIRTEDNTEIIPYGILMIAAAIALALLLVKRRCNN